MSELEETRQALWQWFAFGEWEEINLDALTDEQHEAIETAARRLLGAFCDAIGHKPSDNAYGACVFCARPMVKDGECDHRMGLLVSGLPDTGYSCSIGQCLACGLYGATPYVGFVADGRPETVWRPDWESALEAGQKAKQAWMARHG